MLLKGVSIRKVAAKKPGGLLIGFTLPNKAPFRVSPVGDNCIISEICSAARVADMMIRVA